MANANTKRIVRDGYRNAVVELIGTLDTAAASFSVTPAIDISADFTSNDPGFTSFTGLRVDKIIYSLADGLSAFLYWDATADQVIAAIAGRGKIDVRKDAGLQPDSAAAGYTGDIDLIVYNIAPPAGTIQAYSIVLEMVKLYTK